MSRRLVIAGSSLAALLTVALGFLLLSSDGSAVRSTATRSRGTVERGDASAPKTLAGTTLRVSTECAPSVERAAASAPVGLDASSATTTWASADEAAAGTASDDAGDTGDAGTETPALAQALLGELADPDPALRRDALAILGQNDVLDEAAEDDAVVARVIDLARRDPDALVRRYASRLLALGDVNEHAAVLRELANDTDEGVRANALVGLGRAGDELAQEQLLAYAGATGVAQALERPELAAPAVLAHFERLAADPLASEESREHARQVLAAKRG